MFTTNAPTYNTTVYNLYFRDIDLHYKYAMPYQNKIKLKIVYTHTYNKRNVNILYILVQKSGTLFYSSIAVDICKK